MSKQNANKIFQSYMEEVKAKGQEMIENNIILPTRGAQMRLAGKIVSYNIPMEAVIEVMKQQGFIKESTDDIDLDKAIDDLPDDIKNMF